MCILHGGVRCPHYYRYLYLYAVCNGGHVFNWSGLTFRCAPFSSPPIPATANSQTLSVMLGGQGEHQPDCKEFIIVLTNRDAENQTE